MNKRSNKRSTLTLVIEIIIVALIGLGFIFWRYSIQPKKISQRQIVGSAVPKSFDKSIWDGLITIFYPSSDFAVAADLDQIRAHSDFSPCGQTFLHCFYYIGKKYDGTNFESAGLRINKRNDLNTEKICLETPPVGYNSLSMPTNTKTAPTYSSSAFSEIGDSGAGHASFGSLYHLYDRQTSECYEFETRVAYTQFANYPTGAIKEFTLNDQNSLIKSIQEILQNIYLPGGGKNLFP